MAKTEFPITQGRAHLAILSDNNEVECIAYVVKATITEQFGRISSAEIVLDDGGFCDDDFAIGNSSEMLIGKTVEIGVGYGSKHETVFKGVVIRQRVRISAGHNELVITAKHEAVKMTRVRQNRCHSDMSDSDIAKQLAQNYGITITIDDTALKHETMMQFNATDWDFLNLRVEANALMLYCGADSLVAIKPDVNADPVLEIHNGYNLVSLDAEIDASLAFDSYAARSWNYKSQEVDEEELTAGECDANQGNLRHNDMRDAIGAEKFTILSDNMGTDSALLTTHNDTAATHHALARISGSLAFPGHAKVHPGDIVRLDRCGGRLNGNAFVTAVTHEVNGAIWTTSLQMGTDGVPFAERYPNISSLPANGCLPHTNGLQIGVVEQLEGDPQGEERILVRLHNGDDVTLWARIATPHAGDNRGVCFAPEIGDEVVVAFVNDNPNLAIVLGAMHSSGKPMPTPLSNDNNIKGIFSREGLKMEFDDDKKAITIATPGGNTITLSDDAKGIALEDQNGNKITMNDSGITISSQKAISIEASQDLSMKGANVAAEAQQGFKATGNTGAEVSTSATAVLKGSLVQIN